MGGYWSNYSEEDVKYAVYVGLHKLYKKGLNRGMDKEHQEDAINFVLGKFTELDTKSIDEVKARDNAVMEVFRIEATTPSIKTDADSKGKGVGQAIWEMYQGTTDVLAAALKQKDTGALVAAAEGNLNHREIKHLAKLTNPNLKNNLNKAVEAASTESKYRFVIIGVYMHGLYAGAHFVWREDLKAWGMKHHLEDTETPDKDQTTKLTGLTEEHVVNIGVMVHGGSNKESTYDTIISMIPLIRQYMRGPLGWSDQLILKFYNRANDEQKIESKGFTQGRVVYAKGGGRKSRGNYKKATRHRKKRRLTRRKTKRKSSVYSKRISKRKAKHKTKHKTRRNTKRKTKR